MKCSFACRLCFTDGFAGGDSGDVDVLGDLCELSGAYSRLGFGIGGFESDIGGVDVSQPILPMLTV
jgi:hypothetical protein